MYGMYCNNNLFGEAYKVSRYHNKTTTVVYVAFIILLISSIGIGYSDNLYFLNILATVLYMWARFTVTVYDIPVMSKLNKLIGVNLMYITWICMYLGYTYIM